MEIGISLPVRELHDDLSAVRDFAQSAEGLGFTHLRVPDLVIRPDGGLLHESFTLLSWVAALPSRIELVPSVIILPERQTVLLAKQAAETDLLSGGRLHLGVGVGSIRDEYEALGQDFQTRGRRCDEQIELLRLFWTEETVDFEGRWDQMRGAGMKPLPIQRPIPLWIGPGSGGGRALPASVMRRIGRHSDGWFAILPRAELPAALAEIHRHTATAGRTPVRIGTGAAVPVVDVILVSGLPASPRGKTPAQPTSAYAHSARVSTCRSSGVPPTCGGRAERPLASYGTSE
jgi:probable F420-dependent oxidoreductase